MNPDTNASIWSSEALLAKAQRYAETMLQQDRDEWVFGFWSALTLELLCRAALADVSPVLVADNRDWKNIHYALENGEDAATSSPKSAATNRIIKRLRAVVPDFVKENANFCTVHTNRRNGELHSGDLPFDELKASDWQPHFYLTSQVLLKSIGYELEYLFGPDEAEAAETLIESYKDDAAKAVRGKISSFKDLWESKEEDERTTLSNQADTWASRRSGHRVDCPACGNNSLLQGSPIGRPNTSLEEGMITKKQTFLPSHFECVACGLVIAGHSKLNAAGLGDPYVSTKTHDAVDYMGAVYEPEYEPEYEPDYNEPI